MRVLIVRKLKGFSGFLSVLLAVSFFPFSTFAAQPTVSLLATGLYIDSNGNLGIGTSTPQAGLDVSMTGASSALIVPRDSTANRPSSPVNGMLRYNTDTSTLEGYFGYNWIGIGGASSSYLPLTGGTITGSLTTYGSVTADSGGFFFNTLTNTSGQTQGTEVITNFTPSATSTATIFGTLGAVQTTTGQNVSGADMIGVDAQAISYATSTLGTAAGFAGYVANASTGNITTAQGVNSSVVNGSTGTITSASGLLTGIYNQGSGSITTAYGLNVASPSKGTGSISTYYGLFVATPSAATTNYAVYSQGGTNYFGGKVGVGTTSPQATLDVAGTVRLAKNSSAPSTCSSTIDGEIALTHVYTLCVCNGGTATWVLSSNGTTACSW